MVLFLLSLTRKTLAFESFVWRFYRRHGRNKIIFFNPKFEEIEKTAIILYLEKIHPFEVKKSAIQIKSFLVCFSKGVTEVEESGFCLIGVSDSKTQQFALALLRVVL